MDPNHSLVDFAILSARLSQPFADRATLLGTISEEAWALAASTWRLLMARDPALTTTFQRAFTLERAHQRAPAAPAPRGAVLATGAGVSAREEPAPNPDETQLAPALPTSPALPFVPGTFRPAALPIAPNRATQDPDTTLDPGSKPDETLPFFTRYPSTTRKP